jgi:hypothetical protein
MSVNTLIKEARNTMDANGAKLEPRARAYLRDHYAELFALVDEADAPEVTPHDCYEGPSGRVAWSLREEGGYYLVQVEVVVTVDPDSTCLNLRVADKPARELGACQWQYAASSRARTRTSLAVLLARADDARPE